MGRWGYGIFLSTLISAFLFVLGMDYFDLSSPGFGPAQIIAATLLAGLILIFFMKKKALEAFFALHATNAISLLEQYYADVESYLREQPQLVIFRNWLSGSRFLKNASLLTVSIAFSALFLELALRWVAGAPLTTLELSAFSTNDEAVLTNEFRKYITKNTRPVRQDLIDRYVAQMELPKDVKQTWVQTEPQPYAPKQPRPDLDELMQPYLNDFLTAKFVRRRWNKAYLLDHIKNKKFHWPTLRKISGNIHTFDMPNGSQYPMYRLFPNDPAPEIMLGRDNQGMVTNNFGFRGRDLELAPSPRTIRIAFVGASTTQQHPAESMSFGEYAVHWLNTWTKETSRNIKFEAVIAAHSEFRSMDIAALVENMLKPISVDLVVYMEGANQFAEVKQLLRLKQTDIRYPPTTLEFAFNPSLGIPSAWNKLTRYSVTAQYVKSAFDRYFASSLGEIPKPPYSIDWPDGLDWESPDIKRNDLPLDLPVILKDLDRMRLSLESVGAELSISSFLWMVRDGQKFDRLRHRAIFYYLNGYSVFWPLTYADLRKLADFQNRAWKIYAHQNGLHYTDVASRYPLDPDLFRDGIHRNLTGNKLHGWVAFLELLPLVKKRLAEGKWPRKHTDNPTQFTDPFKSEATTIAKLEQELFKDAMPLAMPAWKAVGKDVSISRVTTELLNFEGNEQQSSYQVSNPEIQVEPKRRYLFRVNADVKRGHLGIGVLNEDSNSWIVFPTSFDTIVFDSGKNRKVRIVVSNMTPEGAEVKASKSTLSLPPVAGN